MKKVAAGILPFRIQDGLEVLLGRPGGPYWARKGDTNWTYFKGRTEPGETLEETARREFHEETGLLVPSNARLIHLGWSKTKSKQILCYGCEMDADPKRMHSNEFEMEWPPKSKVIRTYPEVDEYRWFNIERASSIIMDSQAIFLMRLANRYKDGSIRA